MLDRLPYIPLFQDLSPGESDLLKPIFENFSCPAGTVIFEQGDPATHLYVIMSGTVIIQYKPYDGNPIILTRLRDGDVFGWSAVIGTSKYTSSIVSESRIEALRVRREHLWELVQNSPDVGKRVIDRLARMVSPRWENAHRQIQRLLESKRFGQTGLRL
ncbi:MAG: cyclic nucleotide-binding domain-containing protein [Chloroflexi bacterium]|nr:cyclic nucleotide-binding domain-containing protein [Chloroflexota bacterium]